MIAIREALRFITSYKITKAIIISDSLSVLQSLETGASQSRPNLLEEVKCMISNLFINQAFDLKFMWTPAHSGIVGNERADRLAKQALQRDGTDIVVPLELKEAYSLADSIITVKWQSQWDSTEKGRLYHLIEPVVSNKIKYSNTNRDKETTITRLRLGKCYLNHYLHQISVHSTGLCEQCHSGQPESIEHFMFICKSNNELIEKLTAACKMLKKPLAVETILNNNKIIDIIYTYIKSKNQRV